MRRTSCKVQLMNYRLCCLEPCWTMVNTVQLKTELSVFSNPQRCATQGILHSCSLLQILVLKGGSGSVRTIDGCCHSPLEVCCCPPRSATLHSSHSFITKAWQQGASGLYTYLPQELAYATFVASNAKRKGKFTSFASALAQV